MDYAFAPGFPGHESQEGRLQTASVRRMFNVRAGTKLVPPETSLTSVREFLLYLNKPGSKSADGTPIVLPVGDLLVGAHANRQGKLFIPLFRGQREPTVVETIQKTIGDVDKSIVVPDPLVAPSPTTHALHIKGCNIGKAPKFLTKLRRALGTEDPDNGRVQVTAPKHFHGVTRDFPGGVIEYMAYEFIVGFPLATVNKKLAFPSRTEVVDAFKSPDPPGFNFIDRDDPVEGRTAFPVPASFWDAPNPWIPDDVTRTKKKTIRVELGEKVVRKTKVYIEWQFRVDPEPFPWGPFDIPNFDPDDTTPENRKKNLDSLKADIKMDERFQATEENDFPYYERLGFKNIDAFFDGYDWQFTQAKTGVIATGNRVIYTALIPITDPNTNPDPSKGILLFNFHPSGSASAITHMPVSDDRLFLRLSDV